MSFVIRSEDLRGTRPNPMDAINAQLAKAIRQDMFGDLDREYRWHARRRAALMILAGWQPMGPRARWWRDHEADALAYAEVFT